MLAASQEAVLQAGLEICFKPHLHPHIHSTEFISIAGGGVRRRMGEGNGEVHCNTRHMKKKRKKKKKKTERSWRKCKMAVTLSATMSSLLQRHATAQGSVSVAHAKLGAMHHVTPQEKGFDARTN